MEIFVAIRVDERIVGSDTGQMRRVLHCGKPLVKPIVGLTDHAYLPIGPCLSRDPLNRIVHVLLFSPVMKPPDAFRLASTACVRQNVYVSSLYIPFNGAAFTPGKNRKGGHTN